MNNLDKIKNSEKQIAEQTTKQFPAIMQLFDEGISLLVDATTILEDSSKAINQHTQDGASQTAAWRFLSTLPISANYSFQIALAGNYLVAKHILRLALEETIKLGYYVSFPEQALQQIVRDSDNDHVNLSRMLQQLDPENRLELIKLHAHLSKAYSHANLNLPPELLFTADGKPIYISGGPCFLPDVFKAIAQQLLILVANALKFILKRFPILFENAIWTARALAFIKSILESMGIQIPKAGNEESQEAD
jgi:hypothetical protein